MMVYALLFLEFFKVGLFSIGGGYATLPFLYHISAVYNWYSAKELVDMLAVSSITPGPVGINVATFAGFKTGGILGSVIATCAMVLPALLIVVGISKILKKFNDNFYVQAVLYSVKPAGCALVAAVAVNLFKSSVLRDVSNFSLNEITSFVDLKALFLLIVFFILFHKSKKDPLKFLLIGAIMGIALHLQF